MSCGLSDDVVHSMHSKDVPDVGVVDKSHNLHDQQKDKIKLKPIHNKREQQKGSYGNVDDGYIVEDVDEQLATVVSFTEDSIASRYLFQIVDVSIEHFLCRMLFSHLICLYSIFIIFE